MLDPNLIKGGYGYVPREDELRLVKFFHVPGQGRLELIVISRFLFAAITHWINGLRRPCLNEHCPGCARGAEKAWRFWIDCINFTDSERGLLELGEHQRSWFNSAIVSESIRARTIMLSREKQNANSSICIENTKRSFTIELPEPLDVAALMYKIWHL